MKLTILYNKFITRLVAIAVALVAPAVASAFDLSTYAEHSRLAEGTWVKVGVGRTGMQLLTNAQLRSMGFKDPSKVCVYGYGGDRIPDHMTGYIDDLPQVQSAVTPQGVIFYGIGPVSMQPSDSTFMVPVVNPFTTKGFYFLSDTPAERRAIEADGTPGAANPVGSFMQTLYIKDELTSPGKTGHLLVGDDFISRRSRTYNFTLPDLDKNGADIWMNCRFIARSSELSRLSFSVNGSELAEDVPNIINSTTDTYSHYREGLFSKRFRTTSDKIGVEIGFNSAGTVARANLVHLVISYPRHIRLDGNEPLLFHTRTSGVKLANASASTSVWDVTDPTNIFSLNTSAASDGVAWTNPYTGLRRYVAFNSAGAFDTPTMEGRVSNQDLHAREVPDMVIFTLPDWNAQARRLAEFHKKNDGLDVLVVNQEEVFNEFSSGSPDINGFRKLLKMFYDRSTDERRLQYALFLGRGIYDNRQISVEARSLGYKIMPIWQSNNSQSNTESYTTDDIFAFLEDNSGQNMQSDHYCIAVGRMPVTSPVDAQSAVDKLIEYYSLPRGNWRHRVLILADDEDNAIHMQQAEDLHAAMMESSGGSDITFTKIYTDAYDRAGSTYPMAREEMFKTLDEGVAWWQFVGHANETAWTHEGMLTYTDINNLYLKHYPIVYAATCDFLRWDSQLISAAEVMWRLKGGGAIAVISANRPVYISDNGNLTRALGRNIFKFNDDGTRPTLGQIYRNMKNDFRINGTLAADANKLRYVLLGDPALKPIVPENRVILTSINGVDLDNEEEQAIISARQDVVMEGYIADSHNNPIDDFNGILSSTLYDAEYSVLTKGNGEKGKEFLFDRQGYRLFAGNDSIQNGRFKVNIAMPSSVSDNFRPAAISLYAASADNGALRQAAGTNRDFYVYGTDYSVVDDITPEIRSFYLNHPTFTDGDRVNASPMVIAEISDNRGINMNVVSLGHQMQLMLDDNKSFANVADYYTPSTADAGTGTIAFPLQNLQPGEHTLRLRVWDTSENSAYAYLKFVVDEKLAPEIYDIYADANPASVSTNFYLKHNRPDAMISAKISVYNMLGREVWSQTVSGRSDMFQSFPINWDLTDHNGRRVGRGIYLYRASIAADGIESSTRTRRIAVTGD